MPRNAPLIEARDRKRTMADYDALPPALRDWLAGARMQWEPRSAHRAWRKALWKGLGRTHVARAHMDALEEAALRKQAPPD
ncbi:hypothetical protein SAMN05444004_10148 [Jannaschia faecimaris]|uniref:Uncharacterized protein n=1 Tax=Jannaschia faecimaris TaxID=1244108 RepID=A0A1H3ILL4_9RHOB|nr:DUF6525 family protein [Jannaschia faecimaris]SDY28733.1 hypothetical protein SAMN05444004_10148 [Jannaschia faecimaris]